ncbi:hypothetical protein BBH56_03570 [Spiribacter roseus]|uniref:pilus assembly FimT family protein n=1 Tax=Spiribacter roseus TaxID=1855875 RepID=UPI000F6BA5C6|nr:hypothetical protein BBH56_03570 [Spiribacter roseus]
MRRQAGLTLIEIVFVIGVLGVLATLGFRQFGFAGDALADRIEARDAVIAELRRARAEALYRLPPEDASTVTADLASAAAPVTVTPEEVAFSYQQDDAPEAPDDDAEIEVGDGDSVLMVCVTSKTRRISEGPCP